MSTTRVRFTLGQLMILVAVLAPGMALFRESPALGVVYFVLALGIPILTTAGDGLPRRLRSDVRRVGLCYLGGVVGPAICLVFDPLVFQGYFEDGPMLQPARPFCYTFMGIEMALLALWLWLGEALSPVSGLMAGAFCVGAIYAFCLGILLFPFSALGLLALIGALGFTPFWTAYVYYREAGRAARCAAHQAASPHTHSLAWQPVAGVALAVGIPALVQVAAR